MKTDQRQRQRFLGGAKPLGYRLGDDGELVPVEREQVALARIKELRGAGMALRRVAEMVSAETGVRVSHMLVSRLCNKLEASTSTNLRTPPKESSCRTQPG